MYFEKIAGYIAIATFNLWAD